MTQKHGKRGGGAPPPRTPQWAPATMHCGTVPERIYRGSISVPLRVTAEETSSQIEVWAVVKEIGADLDGGTADTARQHIIAMFSNLHVVLNRKEEELTARVDARFGARI